MAFVAQQNARDAVRALISDGQPSYATAPFGIVRQESLTQQIPPVATPVETTFMVLWSQIPAGKNATVWAVPETIAAYVDGATVPQTIENDGVTSDLDQNGNFTLATPPTSSLLVSYGWQWFNDGDIDQYIASAISWLYQWPDVTTIPDPMNDALALRSASLACQSLARRLRLPDVTAGDAKEALSGIAKGYEQDAKDFETRADQARKDYWSSADQPLQPTAAITSVNYPPYQPYR